MTNWRGPRGCGASYLFQSRQSETSKVYACQPPKRCLRKVGQKITLDIAIHQVEAKETQIKLCLPKLKLLHRQFRPFHASSLEDQTLSLLSSTFRSKGIREQDAVPPGNLDFDARVPIPISVFPSTYRSDTSAETTTEERTSVEGVVRPPRTSRVGREDTREDIGFEYTRDRRPQEVREEVRVYEERPEERPEVEIRRERYARPEDHRVEINVERRDTRDQANESQIDITERDYRRRTDPTYDVEYQRQSGPEVTVTREQINDTSRHNDMGYYDDDGHYHSFRRGLERAGDRVFHPFGGRHHHHHHEHRDEGRTEVHVTAEDSGPSRISDSGVRENVRYVEPRGGYPSNTVTIPCHFIREGDLVILQGRPCQVIRISTSGQTGQYRYLGVDLFTRQLHEESSFVTNPGNSVYVQSMLGPVFKQYRILDIRDDARLVCMTDSGDVKQNLSVIDQGGLFNKIDRAFGDGRGSVRALVINDGGRELIVDYKVIHGSRL